MTTEEAKIVLLEAQLRAAFHTISFMHDCLTSDGYKYAYPEQTLRKLDGIEKLLDIIDLQKYPYCPHSVHKEDCPSCVEAQESRQRLVEASELLNWP